MPRVWMIDTFVAMRLTRVERMIDFSSSLDLIVTLAIALHVIRRRSQVAKAADCKSAIVGSTPTGASFYFCRNVFSQWCCPQGVGKMAASHSNESTVSKRTIMIVEAAGKSQESLQKFFMDQGYRALITQDPERALMRFKTWPRPDLLLVSAQIMLEPAIKLFNSFSKDRYLERVPVLMIGSRQRKQFFIDEAKTDERRKVLLIPFKAETLLSLVDSLIRQSESDE